LSIPVLECLEYDTIEWLGEISHTAFRVTVPARIAAGPVSGTLAVLVNQIRINRIEFVLEIGSTVSGLRRVRTHERQVRKAFASYASDDRDEAMGRIQGMQKIAPELDVFIDVLSLRSGEQWRESLKQEIVRRDVFYLFWSLAASQSDMVNFEWRYALDQRGLDFIDPVPLQPPTVVPPPAELAHLHFSDWTLGFNT
jgi:TIR domain